MKRADVVIIGAGLLGCFTARRLSKYNAEIIVIEKENDVCRGISKANTGIIYTGYDNKGGSYKRKLCVQANEEFDELCRELGVPFYRPGSLMIAYGPRGEERVRGKYESGLSGGIKNLELLSGNEALRLEPKLRRGARLALLAHDTGVVNPWELCIAAYENARANGVAFEFGQEVKSLARREEGFVVETDGETYVAKAVVNAAGLGSDRIRELVEKPALRIYPTAADYIVLDRSEEGFIKHVIFHEAEDGKGVTLVPTVDGNILVGPTDRAIDAASGVDADCDVVESRIFNNSGFKTSRAGLDELKEKCRELAPELALDKQIHNFASLRPKTKSGKLVNGVFAPDDGVSHDDFSVLEENGLFSLIGIKTPGLTFSNVLGGIVADKAADFLGGLSLRDDFDPCRKPIVRVRDLSLEERAALIAEQPEYGEIVCPCMDVSRAEVIEAIKRGATDYESIKRRTGLGMGNCQGSRCRKLIKR